MTNIPHLDHPLSGLLIGLLVCWLLRLARAGSRDNIASPAVAIVRVLLALVALDLVLGALILFLGADGTQDGILAGDVRLRNAAAALACLLVAVVGCARVRLPSSTRHRT